MNGEPMESMPTVRSLDELERLLDREDVVYVRYSEGFAADTASGSIDTESGLELPGLSVNPLTPEDWWTRPVRDWLARQLCQYKHLHEKNFFTIRRMEYWKGCGKAPGSCS